MRAVNALGRRWSELADGLPRPFWALLAGTFINRMGTFVLPLLFIYLTQRRGLTLSLAGVIVGLNGLGSFLGTLTGGVLADRIGRRATMLASLILGALCMLSLGAAKSLEQLAITAFLLGLLADAYRPASQALVADIIAPEHRMKAFALQYWAINLGFALAVAIGGFMARRSFTVLFVADAITTLVLAAVVWAAVPESRPAQSKTVVGSFATPFADRRYLPFLVLNFLVILVFFQHLAALPEDMRAKGFSTEDFGLALATNGVLIVLLQPFVTKRLEGVSRPSQLALASVCTGLGFGLVSVASSLPMYVLTVAVWTLGEIIFAPVNASLVAELSPPALRGRYQGAFGLTWSLAAMLAPGCGAWLIQHTSLRTLWLSCFALGLLTAAAYRFGMSRVLAKP